MGDKNLKAIAIRGTGSVTRRRRQGVPRRHVAHPRRVRAHRRQPLGQRGGHAHPRRPGQRRRRDPHAQLVRGRASRTPATSTPSPSRRSASRSAPATSAPSPAATSTGRARRRDGQGRRPGVRDHRPLRRQLRHRRHRRADEVQRAVRRVGPGHHLLGFRRRPGHGPDREGHPRLRRALRRRRELRRRRPSSWPPRRASAPSWRWASQALAAKYGVPELAMEVKNLELPGYDPRGAFGMSLAYATSDRGGCHMRSYPVGDEIVAGDDAGRHHGGQGRGHRQPRLHRPELQLRQVQRHLVRLLGRRPRPDRASCSSTSGSATSPKTSSC